jgi:YHS domain-containing protein
MKSTIFFVMMVTGLFSLTVAGQDQSLIRKKQFNLEDNIAISGYDPVAYFKTNRAVKGKKEHAVNHQGVIYYFSTAENKEEFKKNASRYEPEYGGWCAYAMGAKCEKVSIDPATFKIVDGKLYLFYNRFFNNTLKTWNKEEATLKMKADANWKKYFH